jgi:hypothetical protein
MPTFTQIGSAVTVGAGGAASIDFSSIPSTYTDLVVKICGRGTRAAVFDYYQIKFNTSTSSFTGKYLYGAGSGSPASGSETNYGGTIPAANATASTFGNTEIYIPNYAGSTNKSYSVDSVSENNATAAEAVFYAGLWSNSAAINQITIIAANGNLAQYSTAYLYGVSNA